MKVRIRRYWLVLLAVCFVLCAAFFVRRTQAAGPFVVNSNVDTSDANPGDGVCATAANVCTLRAAIQEVNKLGGAQGPVVITFDLGGGGNVAPNSGLPFITSPVIIDGATGGTRRVQLVGTNAGSAYGLVLGTGSGGSQISSLVIRNFSIDGLVLGSNGNTIRDCYIGTDFFGTVKQPNGNDGIRIDGSNNAIGGTTASAVNVISGNSRYGVHIDLTTAQGNQIQGNYIGTNNTGAADLGNGNSGIVVRGPFNTIGGNTAEARNIISGNDAYGVDIEGSVASNNTVQGNYIGTNAAGTAAISNSLGGLVISDAPFNTIGGTTGTAGNLISGNSSIGLWLSRSGHNVVQGNLIGTDKTGTMALPNGADAGVSVASSADNLIGGTVSGARNLISGNSGYGVLISGSPSTGNTLQGNYIGTDATGTAALGNGNNGVTVGDSATNNTIGGTTAGAGNVISGNKVEGVFFTQVSGNNLVQGNYIGTNAAGSAALGNGQNGVKILGSPNITVGGLTAGARNVISGNGNDGVLIVTAAATPSKVQGNYIGTDAAGSVALGNGAAGVGLFTANNIVGGTTVQARNVISGNLREGVYIAAIGNSVQGNFIGTNAAGNTALGNALDGVKLDGAPSNFIGGDDDDDGVADGVVQARNIISGNGNVDSFIGRGSGVSIVGSGASNNLVQGNFIGTDVNGTTALSNGLYGILIDGAPFSTIGGTSVGARNLISGNKDVGVAIVESTAVGNLVQGNYIGTNIMGTAPLGNNEGVGIFRAPNNTIGGSGVGARNLISGNNSIGVTIVQSGSSGNLVQGNYIGTDASGTANLGNGFDGVQVGSANNIIGGSGGSGNIIGFNGGCGVRIFTVGSTGNAVLNNSIFSNGQLGIDLNNDGVTPNDTGDGDTGPNNMQNFPVITSAVSNPANNTTVVQGTLNSMANKTFTIQFFSNSAADPTGFGEGQSLRGSTTVSTDSSGNVSFNMTLNAAVVGGQVITATATDSSNNTSEFSQAVTATVQTYSISGQVTISDGGAGLGSVTISLTGSQTATAQTDASGNYSFTLQAGGNYTVTPSKTSFTFNPPSQSFSNLGGNVTANFIATATPQGPTIFVEEGAPNQAVALDSVTFVRGPFPILTDHNFSADHHTRVIVFTSDLGVSQPDSSKLTVTAGGNLLTVENVGTFTGIPGLTASYIVVRLPDGLPAGGLSLVVTLNGVASTNSPTITISP